MYKEAEYYLNKINNREELTEQELLDMTHKFGIENECGENRRWSRMVETICDLNGRYFKVLWDQGLTEMQPDECYEQPVEVELHEWDEVKTIHMREWKEKMILDKNDPNFKFNDNYFQYLIDNNIPFDREDICEFIDGWCYLVKRAEFCDTWTRHITTICKLNEHYYAVEWDAGLTEYGEDYYDEQPYEIFPEEEKQVFIVNKWKNKEGNTVCEFYKKEKNE